MQNALIFPTKKIDYRVIPWATFTEPELSRVGLTEKQARDRYGDDVFVLRQNFDGVDRALAEAAGYGFAKFITKGNGEILGAHIVGPHAGELIHEAVIAMSQNLKVKRSPVHSCVSNPERNQSKNCASAHQAKVREEYVLAKRAQKVL